MPQSSFLSVLFFQLLKTILLALALFVSATLIHSTIAFFFSGSTSEVSTFSTGEWVPAQTHVQLSHNGKLYSSEESVSSYVFEDTDVYTVAYNPEKPQFLSFEYRIKRTDELLVFDQPVARVYLNSHELLQIRTTQPDTGWQQVVLDISEYDLDRGVYDLRIIPSDTYDSEFSPSAEIRSVTTRRLHAIPGDQLVFQPSKEIDFITVAYELGDLGKVQQTEIQSHENQYTLPITDGIATGGVLSYWSIDLFGNTEVQQHLNIQVHAQVLDSQITFHTLQTEGDEQVSVQLSHTLNTMSPIQVQAVATQHKIESEEEWELASQLMIHEHHMHLRERQWQLFQQVDQNLVFTDFPDSMEYLSLKVCNQIGACSAIVSRKK